MDESKLEKANPPLLNRFEKQKMTINDTLTTHDHELVDILKEWVRLISTMTDKPKEFKQNDLFIGFDENETLQSLVIYVSKDNPEAEDHEILEKCKECLIAIASSDGIIRAERSVLERGEVNRWKHVYFHQQQHDSLYDYFAALFKEKSLADPEGHLVIINTFSNINTDIKYCLQGFVRCQVDKLSTFKTEAQLSNRVSQSINLISYIFGG